VQFYFVIAFMLFSGKISASESHSIFDQVGKSFGVSPTVLYGIALQESRVPGTKTPWPWTANINGKGHWFINKESAKQAIENAINSGIKNVDIGLMQVNWRWHGHRFNNVEQALDPRVNLAVAASILKQFKSDPVFIAIGRYHCPGNNISCKQRAHRYALRVVKRLKNL